MSVLDDMIDYGTSTVEERLSRNKEKNGKVEKPGIMGTNVSKDIEDKFSDDVKVIDTDWLDARFIVPDKHLNDTNAANRYWSSADDKFMDTSFGGHVSLNPRPQYTPYADVRRPGRKTNASRVSVIGDIDGTGMGRYYSETHDDNAQKVYMTFGNPKFNSLPNFFLRAIDYVDSTVAKTGRKPYGYYLGSAVGGLVMLAAFPMITVSLWVIKSAIKLFGGGGNFDYYYMEQDMHNYWGTLNTMVTQMSTELGILVPELMSDGSESTKIGNPVKLDQDDLNYMNSILPGIISDNNYIDVFAMVTRPQALATKQLLVDREMYLSGKEKDFDHIGYKKKQFSKIEKDSPGKSFQSYLDSLFSVSKLYDSIGGNSSDGTGVTTEEPSTNTLDSSGEYKRNEDGSYPGYTEKESSWMSMFSSSFDSTVRDGGSYLVLNVDYTGSVSESFSNAVSDIDTGNKVKSLAQASRNLQFNFSGGNILGESVTNAAGYVKDIAAGAIDSVTFGGASVLQTLTGGAYVDIPKKWDDSTASLPQITYTMQLRSYYHNPISDLKNIYIPLFSIMAAMLPKSAGKASYTSPYLCSLFSRGVQNIKMGMITELSITRATGNLGFSRDRQALGIDVSFTVTDFSNILSAPINSSIFDSFNVGLDDDSLLSRYISTLAGRDVLTTKYAMPKAKLALSRFLMSVDQTMSPSSWGMRLGQPMNTVLGGFVSNQKLPKN